MGRKRRRFNSSAIDMGYSNSEMTPIPHIACNNTLAPSTPAQSITDNNSFQLSNTDDEDTKTDVVLSAPTKNSNNAQGD